jgi:phosphoribosylformylglycinamidine synthase
MVKEFRHNAGQAGKGLAITVDCNSRYVFADPYKGAMIAVAEAARNIVCSGGKPLGVTNCLNFGNPYDPEVYYQFVNAVKGMGEACVKFDTPVTGGNVSFYNQGPDGPVYPTPTIGMVGLVEDLNKKMTLDFKKAGDVIYLLGDANNDINSSEYLHKICGIEYSPAPYFNLEEELVLQQKVSALIEQGVIESAHDVSEGGLFITLCESSFHRDLGFDINIPRSEREGQELRADAFLFGEGQSRVIVSVNENSIAAFKKEMEQATCSKLGIVTSGQMKIDGEVWETIQEWKERYDTAIEKYLSNKLEL